jgi:homoserine O-acetyltransferase
MSECVRLRYQKFYWYRVYEESGFSSLEDFLVGFWDEFF